MMFPSKEIVERLRIKYPAGTIVELLEMDDFQAPPIGTKGTVTLSINSYDHTKIPGLLTQSLTIQPSTVCVRSGAPLYYVVTAGFIGYRAPISSDMNAIYGD